MINFIEKIIVDASFEMNEDKGHAIRPIFHDLVRSNFPTAINEVLSAKNKHQYKKYDQIYLDLGEVSLENFQTKIVEILKKKLSEHFFGHEDVILEPHQILLNILEPFLKEGNLTSNAETLWKNYQYIFNNQTQTSQIQKLTIQSLIEVFIEKHPEEFHAFIKQNIKNATIIQRFISHTQEGTLLQLVSFSAQQFVRFFRTFYKTKIDNQLSEQAIKLQLWQNILGSLYEENIPKTSRESLPTIIKNIIEEFSFEQKASLRQTLVSNEIAISPPSFKQEMLKILREKLENVIITKYYSKTYSSVYEFTQELTKLLTKQESTFIENFIQEVTVQFDLKIVQKGVLKYFINQEFFEKNIVASATNQSIFVKTIVQHLLMESDVEQFFYHIEFFRKSQNVAIAEVSKEIYEKTMQILKNTPNFQDLENLQKGQKKQDKWLADSSKLSIQQKEAIQKLKELMGFESHSIFLEKVALDMIVQLLRFGVISPTEFVLIEKGEINLERVIKELLTKKRTLLREKLLEITNKPTSFILSQLKIYLSDDLIEILLEGIGKSLQKISKTKLKELKNKYKAPDDIFEEISFMIQKKVARRYIEEILLFAVQNYYQDFVSYVETLTDEGFKTLLSYNIDFIEHILQEDIRFIENNIDLQFYYLTFFIKNKELPNEIASKMKDQVAFIEKLINYLAEKHPEKLQIILNSFTSKELKKVKALKPQILKKLYKKWTEEELIQKALDLRAKEKAVGQKAERDVTESKELPQKNKEVYIENPGLVLIHPFINTLFRRLGYLADKKTFVDKEIQHRAVHLLQYIVDGNTEPKEEHQLVLNKLLCGVPLREPLLTEITLSETEKETCESLLEGVIGNWKTLKNIKPVNFRASFMKREAKLTDKFDYWELKVEATGVDVLLETLPWSIQMIVFPWMEKSINVDWS